MNSGSCFLAEISRMTSSLSPGGRLSASMSLTKPHRYSRLARVSSVVCALGSLGAIQVQAIPGPICDQISRKNILLYLTRAYERSRPRHPGGPELLQRLEVGAAQDVRSPVFSGFKS